MSEIRIEPIYPGEFPRGKKEFQPEEKKERKSEKPFAEELKKAEDLLEGKTAPREEKGIAPQPEGSSQSTEDFLKKRELAEKAAKIAKENFKIEENQK